MVTLLISNNVIFFRTPFVLSDFYALRVLEIDPKVLVQSVCRGHGMSPQDLRLRPFPRNMLPYKLEKLVLINVRRIEGVKMLNLDHMLRSVVKNKARFAPSLTAIEIFHRPTYFFEYRDFFSDKFVPARGECIHRATTWLCQPGANRRC